MERQMVTPLFQFWDLQLAKYFFKSSQPNNGHIVTLYLFIISHHNYENIKEANGDVSHAPVDGPILLYTWAVLTVPSGLSKESHGVESGHVIGNMDSVGRGKCAHISLCTCMQ